MTMTPPTRRLAREFGYTLLFALLLGAVIGVASRSHEHAGHPHFGAMHAHAEPRSSRWPAVRAAHLKAEPACVICGSTEDLNVHHVLDFHDHPELELVDSNLVTMCRHDHRVWGHLLNWRTSNPDLRKDIARFKAKVAEAKTKPQAAKATQKPACCCGKNCKCPIACDCNCFKGCKCHACQCRDGNDCKY